MESLTPERWQRIRALFDEALGYPAEARSAFLDTRCGENTALRAEVEGLLAAEAAASGLLDGPVEAYAGDLLREMKRETTRQLTGTVAGSYRLLKELGSGGMGTVYLAERADGQFEQQVALKLIKRGMDSDAILQRFLNERQILARLQHPHIAGLLDGGITDEGQPYFAMEYVEGQAIDAYCDAHRLDIVHRLRLFIDVCATVQYAHQNLIVHRDLKPSNILVDAEGQVKLLDFGIAKVLSEEAEDGLTGTGMRVMTPQHAAPEQVRGQVVTTSADIYSLGVVLYELLTGHRPYRVSGLSPSEVEHLVCDQDPKRPSTAVSLADTVTYSGGTTKEVTPEKIGEARAMTPERLKKRLSGDLDNIVLKALRKKPDQRYASAEAFLQDIKRHLDGLPVEARPKAFGYRAQKFVGRHRWGVVASLAFVLVISGLVSFYTIRVTQERDETKHALQRVERISDFTIGLFELADPNEAQGDTLTTLEILARSQDRLQRAFQNEPEVRAEMLDVLGEIHGGLGNYSTAEDLLHEAITLRRTWAETRPEDLSESLKHLGAVQIRSRKLDFALTNMEEALDYARKAYSPNHVEIGVMLDMLGSIAYLQGRYDEVEPYFRQALAIFETPVDGADPNLVNRGAASVLNNLGIFLFYVRQDMTEAEAVLLQGLESFQAIPDLDSHTDLIVLLNSLGDLYTRKEARKEERERELDKALSYYYDALEMSRQLLGNHPSTAQILSNISVTLQYQGCSDDIRPYLEEALEIKLNHADVGEMHPSTAITHHNLAALIRTCEQDPKEAVQLFQKAIDIFRVSSKPNDPNTANSLSELSTTYLILDQFENALQAARSALSIQHKAYSDNPKHTSLGASYNKIGEAYRGLQQPDSAKVYFQRSLELFRAAHGGNHPDQRIPLVNLSNMLVEEGDCEAALPLLENRLQLIEKLDLGVKDDPVAVHEKLEACQAS